MSTITQFPSGNTQYRIEFDYLARTFVVVTLVNSSNPTMNRVLEVGRDYRFINPTVIEMLIDQSGFDIVRIHRQTGTDLVVDFRNGSVLTASDLTNAELQAIHIAEEGRDQTVDLAKEYADAAGNSAGNAKDSEDEARRIAESIKASGLGYITRRSFEKGFNVTIWNEVLLWEEDGDYYRWDGGLPKTVPVGSTPETSGGVGLGAWVSVGDASLRADIAKPTGTNLIGTKNGETLSTVLSSRWANSGADKKEIRFDLPLLFPDYDAILAAHPDWTFIYPGSFCIGDDGKIYITYGPSNNAATERFVVVYSGEGEYLGYLQTNNGGTGVNGSAVSEGIIVTNYYGSLKLFLGSYDGNLAEFDISAVTYGTTISYTALHQVGLYNQFSFHNGMWAVEQAIPALGINRQRNVIAYFNSAFALTGFTEFSPYDAGYITSTTTDYGSLQTKRQAICLAPGVLIMAFGGVYITGTTVEAPTNYQGVKAFSTDGHKMVEAVIPPTDFISVLDAKGLMTSRIENEGVCYSNGEVFTLWIYNNRTASNAYTNGILITKEYSNSPDLDFSGAVTVSPGYDTVRMASGVYPRILAGDKLYNPLTGAAMTSMSEVLDFMRLSGQKEVTIYTSSTGLTDLDGVAYPIGIELHISNLNNLSFSIDQTGPITRKTVRVTYDTSGYTVITGAIGLETYRLTLNNTDSGALTQGRIAARAFGNKTLTESEQILVLDQQSSASAHSLILGGGSSVFKSATSISFATNPSPETVGGTIRWRIDNTSLRPYTDSAYNLGGPALRVAQVFAAIGTINTSDSREKTYPFEISDDILDAWGDVQIITYKWLSSIAAKGEDSARWHFGVIAQQVRDAFVKHGLDGTTFGLLCYDEWEDEYEPEFVDEVITVNIDGVDTEVTRQVETGNTILTRAAGNRWGIRPDQCFWLEAAYQRRRCDRIETRLDKLEGCGGRG